MSSVISSLDVLSEFFRIIILLLAVNALLSGLAILLAWRLAYWKHLALHGSGSYSCSDTDSSVEALRPDFDPSETPSIHTPLLTVGRPPVPKMNDMRRIPAVRFPRKKT
jgi:hypothetical protein